MSLRQKIYRSIRDDITYGRLNPGERLIESELAKRFGASRSPIREALRQLEAENLLTLRSNSGATVSKLSIKQVDEIYNIRLLLESYAVKLTAERLHEEHTKYLRDLNCECRSAIEKYDLTKWLYHNELFHNFFYENCGNDNLRNLLETLGRRVYRYRYIIVSIPGHFETYLDQHELIIRACERKESEAAKKGMQMHIMKIKEILIDHLNNYDKLNRAPYQFLNIFLEY